MTDEKTYETGPIRPPSEARSLLLRVTRNCPWNRCRFCTTYKAAEFEIRPAEEVMRDIDSMAFIAERLKEETEKQDTSGLMTHSVLEALSKDGIQPHYSYQVALFVAGGGKNVFLQDGNSPEMETDDLAKILRHLYRKFPSIERVTSYARSMTLAKCGAAALGQLREAGLTRVHVGLESGSDEVLKLIRKGVIAKHHIRGGRAAKEAGLELSEYVMPGVGGLALSETHARETARVLNEINPDFIRLRSFFPLPGSGLAESIERGEIELPSEDDLVREIRLMVDGLDGIDSYLVSDHDRNLLMEVEGRLPEDKQGMLALLDGYLELSDELRQIFRIGRRIGQFRVLADLEMEQARAATRKVIAQLEARYGDADKGLLQIIDVHM